jgi:hypothetical protein
MKKWLIAILVVCADSPFTWAQNADFDGNGQVNFDDFFLFVDQFGQNVNTENQRFDLSNDLTINFDDFFLFVDQFGQGASPAAGEELRQEEVAVALTLPTGTSLEPEALKVTTPLGSVSLSEAGGAEVTTVAVEKPQIVLVEDAAGNPVLLGYALPSNNSVSAKMISTPLTQAAGSGGNIQVSPTSTALALVMMNPLLFGSSGAQRQQIAERVVVHADFPALVSLIETRLRANPGTTLLGGDASPVYEQASAILISILQQNAVRQKNIRAEDEEAPWIEDVSGSNDLIFVNSNFIYYSWGVTRQGAAGYDATGVMNPREAFFELIRWPPIRFHDESRTEPFNLPDGEYTVFITKGGNYPVSRLIDLQDPVGRATLFNTGAIIWNIFDLLIGVPEARTRLGELKLTFPIGTLNSIGMAISQGNVRGVLEAVIEVALENGKNIGTWLWKITAKDSVTAYTKKLLPLLKKASFALQVLNATNTVAFVWDLATAPREVYYQIVQTNGVLEQWVGATRLPLYKGLVGYGQSSRLTLDTRDLPPYLIGYGLSNPLVLDTRNLPPTPLEGYGFSAQLILDTRRGMTGYAESPVFTVDLRSASEL